MWRRIMFNRYRKFIKLVVLKHKLEKEIKHLAGREEQLKMEISYIEERLDAMNLTQEEKENYFLMFLEEENV